MTERRWLQWCNGRHYYRLEDNCCPGSGAGHPPTTAKLREAASVATSYEDLIRAGVAEEHILELLSVPQAMNEDDCERLLLTPCGADVTEELAHLVCARNKIILAAFPDGQLWNELHPKRRLVWYARRLPDRDWHLVDLRDRFRWNAWPGYREGDEQHNAQALAGTLGITVQELKRVEVGEACAGLEVVQLSAPEDHACLVIDGELEIASLQEEAFVGENFSLTSTGHVQFLLRFYDPSR